jgi:hypothetical protein
VEQLSGSILRVFELISDHLNALVSLAFSVKLLNDLSFGKVKINLTILVQFIDKEHRLFVIVEQKILGLVDMATFFFEWGHLHRILELLLVFVDLLADIVYFDDGAINDEYAVVRMRLQGSSLLRSRNSGSRSSSNLEILLSSESESNAFRYL